MEMGNINHFRFLLILLTVLQDNGLGTTCERIRRGFGDYDLFGNSRQSAFDEINRNQDVALWSAQSAVTSSVGQDYGQQLAHLALQTHQFTIPSTNSNSKESSLGKSSEDQKNNSHDATKSPSKEAQNPDDDHASDLVTKESVDYQEGHRVARKPEKDEPSQKPSPNTSWVGIRSRPNRKGRRIPSHPKKQSCSNTQKN